jgi:hypothetical protein
MEPSIDENTISHRSEKRSSNTEKLNRDLQRWRRKRATIVKYMQEEFGLPATDKGIELDIYEPKR